MEISFYLDLDFIAGLFVTYVCLGSLVAFAWSIYKASGISRDEDYFWGLEPKRAIFVFPIIVLVWPYILWVMINDA